MNKTALITGICGQDAAYMTQLLREKGYRVIGVGRSMTHENQWRLRHVSVHDQIELIAGDITDASFLFRLMQQYTPDECYNFAAISFIGQSWSIPKSTIDTNTRGLVNILEAIRQCSPKTRLYHAGSSEMFGQPETNMQKEGDRFLPCNPYGVSKVAGFHFIDIYRRAHGVHACVAICYNHESPLRGIEYVTRKITDGVARIALGKSTELRLGNIEARRDWGFAGDYVQGMWAMLQHETPDDYILATGQTHSIREFLDIDFQHAGVANWESHVVQDERFYRPLEPKLLCGDNTKIKERLGWAPHMAFADIVRMMVDADLKRVAKES